MQKNSWGGCGNHLTALYARIEKGKQCMRRPWLGVVILPEETAAGKQPSHDGCSPVAISEVTAEHSCLCEMESLKLKWRVASFLEENNNVTDPPFTRACDCKKQRVPSVHFYKTFIPSSLLYLSKSFSSAIIITEVPGAINESERHVFRPEFQEGENH
uniref:Uncharacterized protein n=1 Tax=Salix viminalis TaxID=40686 RepID=A0A6N2LCX3_SALVM